MCEGFLKAEAAVPAEDSLEPSPRVSKNLTQEAKRRGGDEGHGVGT